MTLQASFFLSFHSGRRFSSFPSPSIYCYSLSSLSQRIHRLPFLSLSHLYRPSLSLFHPSSLLLSLHLFFFLPSIDISSLHNFIDSSVLFALLFFSPQTLSPLFSPFVHFLPSILLFPHSTSIFYHIQYPHGYLLLHYHIIIPSSSLISPPPPPFLPFFFVSRS